MNIKLASFLIFAMLLIFSIFYFYWIGPNHSTGLTVSGNIETTEIRSSFRIAGRLQKRFLDEGDRIQKGQIIAVLDQQDLLKTVELQEARLEEAKARLMELEKGSLPEELAQALAKLEQAKADFIRLQQDFSRQKNLLQEDVISPKEFEASLAALAIAETKKEEAEKYYELLRNGTRVEKILQARAFLEASQKEYDLAKINLSYGILESPLTGIVLTKHAEPGEYVHPGTPILTLANLENVWLRAYVSESDLGKIYLGQSVELKIDSFPDKVYRGQIVYIASEAEFTPKNIQTQKERVKLVYRIKIKVENQKLELKPGMPADGKILL